MFYLPHIDPLYQTIVSDVASTVPRLKLIPQLVGSLMPTSSQIAPLPQITPGSLNVLLPSRVVGAIIERNQLSMTNDESIEVVPSTAPGRVTAAGWSRDAFTAASTSRGAPIPPI